ncbi:MAG: hypothetical protein MP439_04025 [Ferrimicrobium sp.]|nr:hypothetical protein [Ferrimicrobium sp.]
MVESWLFLLCGYDPNPRATRSQGIAITLAINPTMYAGTPIAPRGWFDERYQELASTNAEAVPVPRTRIRPKGAEILVLAVCR